MDTLRDSVSSLSVLRKLNLHWPEQNSGPTGGTHLANISRNLRQAGSLYLLATSGPKELSPLYLMGNFVLLLEIVLRRKKTLLHQTKLLLHFSPEAV